MIELLEVKDINSLFAKIQTLNERTKRHTEQIQELQKQLNSCKEVNKDGTSD